MQLATLILVYIIGTAGMYPRYYQRRAKYDDWFDKVMCMVLALLWPITVWPWMWTE